jgi:hypothetical protein
VGRDHLILFGGDRVVTQSREMGDSAAASGNMSVLSGQQWWAELDVKAYGLLICFISAKEV